MIKWYKPSEKMPEIGKTFVAIDENVEKMLCYTFDKSLISEVVEKRMYLWSYWAYASDFNFPKDEK